MHTSQQLARGIADDVDLMTWLHHRIWPYESNMTEDDSYLSTLLCGIELIHSGVSPFIFLFKLEFSLMFGIIITIIILYRLLALLKLGASMCLEWLVLLKNWACAPA